MIGGEDARHLRVKSLRLERLGCTVGLGKEDHLFIQLYAAFKKKGFEKSCTPVSRFLNAFRQHFCIVCGTDSQEL